MAAAISSVHSGVGPFDQFNAPISSGSVPGKVAAASLDTSKCATPPNTTNKASSDTTDTTAMPHRNSRGRPYTGRERSTRGKEGPYIKRLQDEGEVMNPTRLVAAQSLRPWIQPRSPYRGTMRDAVEPAE